MQATVDLPKELLERAQTVAERRGVSLGDLIGAALKRDLGREEDLLPTRRRVRFPIFPSRSPGSLALTNADVARIEAEEDERRNVLPR